MSQNNGSVPPLPPRRSVSIVRQSRPISKSGSTASSDARLLQSVPPPPQHTKYRDLIAIEDLDLNDNNRNSDHQNNNSIINDNTFESQVSTHPLLFNTDLSLTNPELRLTPTTSLNATINSNQSYIQWQNKSIPPNSLFPNPNLGSIRPQMWSYVPNNCTNSFSNYSYSSSSGVSPVTGLSLRPLPPLSHSMSAPTFPTNCFSNTTYSYSYSPVFQAMTPNISATTTVTTGEDLQKLVTNGKHLAHNILVKKMSNKASNSDLIDLIDTMENKDVLELFDPLAQNQINLNETDNNELNFSNNFELDSDSSTTDEIDKSVEESTNSKSEDSDKVSNKSGDVCQPFRVIEKKNRANEELGHFCDQLKQLRRQYHYTDFIANTGLVISPTLDSPHDNSLSVKLVIESQLRPQPISFTCNVNTSVEHIISQVIVTIAEDRTDVKMEEYLLKVYGLTEYFATDSVLADYSYVHQCHKLDKDVHLSLVTIKDMKRLFARTAKDDQTIDFTVEDIIPKAIFCKFSDLKPENFNILLDNFDREIIKLRADARMSGGGQLQPQSIIQTTKAICMQLSSLETISLTESHVNFEQLCKAFGSYKRDSIIASDDNTTESRIQSIPDIDSKLWEILDNALLKLKTALAQLIRLYSQTFPVEFDISSDLLQSNKKKTKKDISSSMDTFVCQIGVCCQLPPEWLTNYKEFKIRLQLIHGNTKLSTCYSKVVSPSKSLFYRLSFDELIQLDWPIFNLPREVKLECTLIGVKNVTQSEAMSSSPTPSSNSSNSSQESFQELGVGSIYLFDFRQILADGQHLIPLWINSSDFNIEEDRHLLNTICFERTNPIIHIIIPETDYEIKFPAVVWDQTSDTSDKLRRNINLLDSATQTELFQLLNSNPLEPMSCGGREQLWDRRYYLYDNPEALPKVLLASHSWEWSTLADIYTMVQHWSHLSPVDSMQLLLASFPDIHIRQMAVKWLKKLSSDELCDFLPQLVQALRFDTYIDCPLIWFLLESSLSSVRVCHYLYWILKCNINDQTFGYRSRIYLNSLLAISGQSTNEMIDRQELLCNYLSQICSHIKSAKESQRLNTLLLELETINDFLIEKPTVLPLSPSMLVCGLDVKNCSYFPSNSLPLKLVFKNPDTKTSSSALEAIFKAGDDLRQDMLSMQMIQIMDKVWLKAGLDLRMVTFGCIATDFKKGMIEMVRDSETLRKIQVEHGLTGSFKDRPIAEWLKKHNTSELEYHKAVENFMYSCAGYSVATYLLGICDRHNDNIMLTTCGHLFHIDFGKFLGDSQMMAGFKRDRVAFVLTQDMAFVINGGDKPSKQFQFFIDLCCQAFNLLRKNGNFLLSLFSLMMSSRISGLNIDAVKYIHRALMPGLSESEAMSQFTRMIEESLRSRFTKFNFFIHSLAQMRFTGDHNDQMLLSFIPKTFTKESDGEITNLEIMDCYKKYETEIGKVYYYVVKVDRQYESDPSFIHRTYREFLEFNEKLNSLYPLAKFHVLPRPSNLIRSNTRDSALQRMNEIHQFIKGLMLLAHEISHADIVYTFFHPLLRDQEGAQNNTISIISPPVSTTTTSANRRDTLYGPTITGQVKLSIVYKNMSLVIMIMHAKNLHSSRSAAPDCYVKTYLIPDPNKSTKRKTRVVNKSCHPTFMEMIVYTGISLEKLQQKTLQVSVWDYDRVTENVLLGGTHIILSQLDLKNEICDWFPLQGNN